MKFKKSMLCFSLAITVCTSYAVAVSPHVHESQPLPRDIVVSPWARDEVAEAMELGFGPSTEEYRYLPDSLSAPVRREWFCTYASRFIAFQQKCDESSLTDVILYYQAEKDDLGQPKSAFSDMPGVNYLTALYYLGVTNGRGDGTFDPNEQLTRQEAAAFLARIYQAYGGTLPGNMPTLTYSDASQIADWARDSVASMSIAGIMNGYDDGRFAPNDPYSHEQCLLTFLRLYENMDISRKNGNVKPLYTYDQYMNYVTGKDQQATQQGGGIYMKRRVDGPVATFVQQVSGGGMGSTPQFKFVYRVGAMESILDFGVCDTGWGRLSNSIQLENPHFSEDGKTFYCTITLKNAVKNPYENELSNVGHDHEAGIYAVEIDIETLEVQATRK